jgi:AcrR family transcriptional regulator
MATRRRGDELEATILDAAYAEMQEHGYGRLTMEGVAARAHTGKQVLYRRWPNRAQLMISAIRHTLGPMIPAVPDTGSLREDILAVLRMMTARARSYTPELIYGLLAELPDDDTNFFHQAPDAVVQVLAQAVARGELKHADFPLRVTALPVDLMRLEGLRHPRTWLTLTDAEVEAGLVEIVDGVWLPLVTALAGLDPRT